MRAWRGCIGIFPRATGRRPWIQRTQWSRRDPGVVCVVVLINLFPLRKEKFVLSLVTAHAACRSSEEAAWNGDTKACQESLDSGSNPLVPLCHATENAPATPHQLHKPQAAPQNTSSLNPLVSIVSIKNNTHAVTSEVPDDQCQKPSRVLPTSLCKLG